MRLPNILDEAVIDWSLMRVHGGCEALSTGASSAVACPGRVMVSVSGLRTITQKRCYRPLEPSVKLHGVTCPPPSHSVNFSQLRGARAPSRQILPTSRKAVQHRAPESRTSAAGVRRNAQANLAHATAAGGQMSHAEAQRRPRMMMSNAG